MYTNGQMEGAKIKVLSGAKITLIVFKLRTYFTFEENYETESFVYKVHNWEHRSLLTKFRCGILSLKIETGH